MYRGLEVGLRFVYWRPIVFEYKTTKILILRLKEKQHTADVTPAYEDENENLITVDITSAYEYAYEYDE